MAAITIGGAKYVDRVAEVISLSFATLPLTTYTFRQPDSTWPANDVPFDVVWPVYRENIGRKAAAGAELAEAGDFAAVAIWFPPGVAVPESPDVAPRMLEYREVFSRMKKDHLRGASWWRVERGLLYMA
ncbi:hypothetical protein QBC46DRAFT_356282 [Diplogelasinospora grovesii]|uniref:Uncharacterized protein n=1 Tax=Diplogelasinospora grovesii TaxID=303347 RepID=A0AAN6N3Y3_9PEZI|nr:hypothetical protein QBC46DRAFT_356282 [Diplogelasinospora grovesii]